eukprot:459740_1
MDFNSRKLSKKWQKINTDIPIANGKHIRPTPFYLKDTNNICYSFGYRRNIRYKAGIYQYNINDNKHILITKWQDLNYLPIHCTSIYNKTKQCIIFVGGKNAGDNKKHFKCIFLYDIKHKTMTQIAVNDIFGEVPLLLLTNNDRHLHIACGNPNNYHYIFDLETNTYNAISCFKNTQHCSSNGHALIYDKFQNRCLLLGGYSFTHTEYINDCYILDLNKSISTLSLNKCSQLLINGFMRNITANYPNVFIKIIEMYVKYQEFPYSQWIRYEKYKLPKKMAYFSHILYKDKIIITFGGWCKGTTAIGSTYGINGKSNIMDNIYFMDITNNDGWKLSKLKCPNTGCYAVILVGSTVHLLPRNTSNVNHYTIEIDTIFH